MVQHILEDGSLESHSQALTRLLSILSLAEHDMFHTREDQINEAYRLQGADCVRRERSGCWRAFHPIEHIV